MTGKESDLSNNDNAIWLTGITAVIGGTLTFLLILFFMLYLPVYVQLLYKLQDYLAWIAFILGAGATILLSTLIYLYQIAKQHAEALDLANQELKSKAEERIAVEESKQKLEIALLQGQKLQAIGTLAGGIAHDFNNILYAINGYAEMTRSDIEKDTITYKNLGKIIQACVRGKDLIARILAFSRKQQTHFESLNLRTTIEAAIALLKPTIPASVTLEYQLTDAFIEGDQTQLHQVIVNLINNAVDAMDDEGKITIELTHRYQNNQQRYCQINVTDTGHGIDQTTQERIFEPFYTTKPVGKGTGLGLSIAHTIIEEHQGTIEVHSQLGVGTTFTILLPEQGEGV